jgi:hypothetical protein
VFGVFCGVDVLAGALIVRPFEMLPPLLPPAPPLNSPADVTRLPITFTSAGVDSGELQLDMIS